jgi:hypothetical protein
VLLAGDKQFRKFKRTNEVRQINEQSDLEESKMPYSVVQHKITEANVVKQNHNFPS